ncbi:MAG TPA: AMP-binding protein, partial [Thermoanaerobaculia bacterium]|nr:AMP-binding protein [Thermoanaerobaculia bacterium]
GAAAASAAPASAAAASAAESPAAPIHPDQAAYIFFTSGSTGRPKGVVVSHGALANRICLDLDAGCGPADRYLMRSSLAFDVSLVQIWTPLTAGGTVIVVAPGSESDARYLAQLIREEGITHASFPSTQLDALLADPELADLGRLRFMAGGVEAMPPELPARFFRLADCRRAALWNRYGPTEATVAATQWRCRPEPEPRCVPIGRPFAGASVLLLDAALRPAPLGVVAEIAIGGGGVARGYLDDPALTAARFIPDPLPGAGGGRGGARLYRTGDLGRWRSDGALEFVGRLDRQVKIRGYRVEPGEVTAALRMHRAVGEAVAVAWPATEPSRSPRLVAYYTLHEPGGAGQEGLRSHLRRLLPEYMLPWALVEVAALPFTPAGKVDLAALPHPDGAGAAGAVNGMAAARRAGNGAGGSAPALTPVEETLAAIWRELLGVEQVSTDDNFFELGGDSVLSIRVVARAREAGLTLAPRDLFARQTLAELAELPGIAAEAPRHASSPAAGSCSPATGPGGPPGFELDQEQLDAVRAVADLEDVYPLSPLQQGILFHGLYQPEEAAYVGQMTCLLHGELDPELLALAWQRTVNRHPALRTAFVWERLDQPLQAVRRQVPAPMEHRDWRGVAADDLPAQLARELASQRRLGFDLTRPPLARPVLVRLAARRHRLIWTAHHLVVDGWSVGLLLTDLLEHYAATRQGREPALAPARPYKDFVAWQRQWSGREAAAAEAFWRAALRGVTQATPLPGERREAWPRAVAPPDDGHDEALPGVPRQPDHQERIEARLTAAPTAALQSFTRRHRLTLNTAVQGAWALLLGRWAGTEEVVFGSVVAGRPPALARAEGISGLLINTLPVRCPLPAAAEPAGWLAGLQARQLEQQPFEQTPLPSIQSWSELPPGTALFASLYSFQSFTTAAAGRRASGGGIEVDELRSWQRTHYPLTLTVTPPRPAELGFQLSYDRRRVSGLTAAKLLVQLAELLAALPAAAGRSLAALPLLAAAERHQLLYEWSGEEHGETGCRGAGRAPRAAGGDPRDPEAGAGSCLDELFGAWAARAPHRPALACGDAALSYGELDRLAGKLAARLAALGAAPEVLVAVCLPRSLDLVVALLAVLRSGAAYVPLDPDYPPERLAFVLADSGARLLLARSQLAATLTEVPAPPAGGAARYRLVACDDLCPPLPEPSAAGAAGDGPAPAGGRHLAGRRDPRHLAYVIYTSGSTGRPKGVPVSHANVGRLLAAARPCFAFGADDVWTLFHSPAFD